MFDRELRVRIAKLEQKAKRQHYITAGYVAVTVFLILLLLIGWGELQEYLVGFEFVPPFLDARLFFLAAILVGGYRSYVSHRKYKSQVVDIEETKRSKQ